MERSSFLKEPITPVLREHEAGVSTAVVCRKHGFRSATVYAWKAKHGWVGGGLRGQTAKDARGLDCESNATPRRSTGSHLRFLLQKNPDHCRKAGRCPRFPARAALDTARKTGPRSTPVSFVSDQSANLPTPPFVPGRSPPKSPGTPSHPAGRCRTVSARPSTDARRGAERSRLPRPRPCLIRDRQTGLTLRPLPPAHRRSAYRSLSRGARTRPTFRSVTAGPAGAHSACPRLSKFRGAEPSRLGPAPTASACILTTTVDRPRNRIGSADRLLLHRRSITDFSRELWFRSMTNGKQSKTGHSRVYPFSSTPPDPVRPV